MSNQSQNRSLVNEEAAQLDWEKKNIVPDKLTDEMKSMWEIPQIFHFLQLIKNALNITHLSMYEMERMFLMPTASKQLADIVTCLLRSTNLRSRPHKIPPMPYESWNNKLMHKVRRWFKIYKTQHKNTITVFNSIGVEPEFWNIFTDISCIDDKDFAKLTLKQRVWLLKTLCDTTLHTRKAVQEELSKQPSENKIESTLGIDRHGARYIYFPQFLQNNIRVYRHCLNDEILSTVESSAVDEHVDELSLQVKEDNAVICPAGKAVRNKTRKRCRRNEILPYDGKKRKEWKKREKYDELGNGPYNNDAVNDLLTSESRNLSESTSLGDNDNINYNLITPTGSKSMFKTPIKKSGGSKFSFNKASDCLKDEKSENKLQSEIKQDDEAANNVDSKYESSSIEWRDILINEASLDEPSCSYNFTNVTRVNEDSCNTAVEDFNEILTDPSSSHFELIADSVESLRNFIDDFSHTENHSAGSNKDVDTFIPTCEVDLIRKMSDLLTSVESMETALIDATKKARSKLRREWLNFKNGMIQEQKSSGKTGSTSNLWIYGSRGSTLPNNNKAILHTERHSALLPSGSQNQAENTDGECDKRTEHLMPKQKPKFNDEEEDAGRRKGNRNGRINKNGEQEESEDGQSKSEELKQQTKMVLRGRRISSYMDLPLSDESEAGELEGRTNFEAVYSAPCIQAKSSSPHVPPQSRKCDKRSKAEDSDQDWVLPGSSKRRNKRPSASRGLKSSQHKHQTIKVNSNLSSPPNTVSLEVADERSDSNRPTEMNTKKELQSSISKNENASTSFAMNESNTITNESPEKVVPSSSTTCEFGYVDSVHSELDIRDEGPVVDSLANNNNTNVQTNYIVVNSEPPPVTNYYVMQQNPPITGVVEQRPFIQQAAFVPSGIPQAQQVYSVFPGYSVQHTPNYVVQSSQPGFGPPAYPIGLQPPQHVVIQQTPQIIGTQQIITQPNYVQYMANNSQQSVISTCLPNPRMAFTDRQNCAHPNRALIRSTPLTGNRTIFPGTRSVAPQNIVRRQNSRNAAPRSQKLTKSNAESVTPTSQNTNSSIILSGNDDEIKMINTRKPNEKAASEASVSLIRKNVGQPAQRRKPIVTSEITISKAKRTLPLQIIQRLSSGGISMTPVKTNPPPNPNTQLVVVVNETGSHYALALPCGNKLILTPEQVAQIRASTGGTLSLQNM